MTSIAPRVSFLYQRIETYRSFSSGARSMLELNSEILAYSFSVFFLNMPLRNRLCLKVLRRVTGKLDS